MGRKKGAFMIKKITSNIKLMFERIKIFFNFICKERVYFLFNKKLSTNKYFEIQSGKWGYWSYFNFCFNSKSN
jgi:hypothetical protein